MFADHSTTADGAFIFYLSGGEDVSILANSFLSAAVTLVGDGFMVSAALVVKPL